MRSGAVNALAVVTTAVASARSSVFVEGRTRKELYSSYGIDYEPVRIANVHVRASAAIPTFFPAVRIDSPARARGWYFDGGTRLNTPIKPVLDLGADRLVLLATDSIERTRVPPAKAPDAAPDFSGGAVELLQATLVDPLCNDVRMLGKINLLAGEESGSSDVDRYQEARGKRPYRQIPYIFVAPSSRGELGRRATEVFSRSLRGPQGPSLTGLRPAHPPARRGGALARRAPVLSVLRARLRRRPDRDGPERREVVARPGGWPRCPVVPRSRGPTARRHGVVAPSAGRSSSRCAPSAT
ncbi:MAG: patatin-like phospholipase family protein [Thermoleophilaceae bacterium]